ncbi:MAG: 4-hydroxy-tetrahydrodipicolinate reductase [Gemmatimonadaceae bacterium]
MTAPTPPAPPTRPTLKLAVIGMGKMGRAVAALAPERGFEVVATIGGRENAGGSGISAGSLRGADVAVEFTEPGAAPTNVEACVDAGVPVVCGTTGWYDQLDAVASDVERNHGALLYAANFSVGMAVFVEAVAAAARAVAAAGGFDAHVVETHHAAKKDAPSGTALVIERALAAALGRPTPVTSVRVGSVPGTHEVVFDGAFEQIRLEHLARDRRVFADGALAAARWLVGRRGVFTMRDVLLAGRGPATTGEGT